MTRDEWSAAARDRYGHDIMGWRFRCPACGHVASVGDWKAAEAPEGAVAFSCVGRFLPGQPKEAFADGPGPCTYAGGGLFRLNPVTVTDDNGLEHQLFDFADRPLAAPPKEAADHG